MISGWTFYDRHGNVLTAGRMGPTGVTGPTGPTGATGPTGPETWLGYAKWGTD